MLASSITVYESYLRSNAGDVDAALELAGIHIGAGESAAALPWLDAGKPASARLYRLRALAHRGAALEIFARMPAATAEKHALTGLFRFEAGLYREAFYHYRKALALEEDFPSAHAAVSEIYHRTGHPDWAEIEVQLEKNRPPPRGGYKDAIDHLQAAATAEFELGQLPESWEKLDLQARAARDKRAYAEAVALYRKALKLSPGNVALEKELGRCLWFAGQFREAVPLLERQKLLPELAAAQAELGDVEKSLAAIRASGQPRDMESAKLIARTYVELGKPALGIPMLQALAAQDIDGSLHQALGEAYQAMHRPTAAGPALRRAAELRSQQGDESKTEITAPR